MSCEEDDWLLQNIGPDEDEELVDGQPGCLDGDTMTERGCRVDLVTYYPDSNLSYTSSAWTILLG